jgi:hypothetical protein
MLGHPGLAPSVPSLALSHAKIPPSAAARGTLAPRHCVPASFPRALLKLVELGWLCHLEFSTQPPARIKKSA